MKKIICFLVIAEIVTASLFFGGNNAFASLSSDHASTWSQYCASHSSTCAKNENPGARSGSVGCTNNSQVIDKILVHAGDGQNVYELPDSKFSYSTNGNTVTVTANNGSHDLSWIMVTCKTGETTPPPPPPTDVCPNIDGNQSIIPDGYHLVEGECVLNTNETPPPPPTDMCPNIDGNQSVVPEGYHLTDDVCVKDENNTPPPPPTDVCPNIDGNQSVVPEGYESNNDGLCVAKPNDPGSGSTNNNNNSNNNSNSSNSNNSNSTTGSVLGVSTFAGTGSADLFQQSLLGFGLTTQTIGAGVMLLKRKSKKN